ncbi:DUF3883 domain-containing protein [Burkholderia sp. Ed8]|uniref:DUF3883 domain-containing protein n=1 Tax=Burkholderia sp. Ed8 TaxID=3112957 RepID=UPI00345C8FC0
MQNEVPPVVLKYLDNRRLAGKNLSATELLTKLGVKDARNLNSEYAWRRQGDPEVICTVWAEFIQIDPRGRWYTKERLQAETRLGGGERTPVQKRRGQERIDLLRLAANSGKAVIAFLQINQKSIKELEQNESAATSVRVKDDEVWHVVGWDEAKKEAWLVRGTDPWIPTVNQADLTFDEAQPGSPDTSETPPSGSENDSNFGFPDADTRKKVEKAAVDFVTLHYDSEGYRVDNEEKSNLGYDLAIFDSTTGELIAAVEVKGTSGDAPNFYITRNERACAAKLGVWQLAIVT